MKDVRKYKRPCDQCRTAHKWAVTRGEHAEGSRIEHAHCCGAWVYTLTNGKLAWRRPYATEYRW